MRSMTDEVSMTTTTIEEVLSLLPPIPADSNKFTRGRLFMVCGSYGMAGAVIMAAKAAFRTGAGYIDLALPKSLYPIVTAAVPEAVCSVYDEEKHENIVSTLFTGIKKADAVVLGCGLGALRETVCPIVLELCDKPLLIDADGLNFLGMHPEITCLSQDMVLTPHEGEMARLLKTESVKVRENREEACYQAAEKYNAAVLLKGPDTLIVKEGREIHKNPTGNAGLSRAGSGDVLSGIIGSLMAQGEDAFPAALSGAYIHGLAGDLGKEKKGVRSLLPTDLIELLPEALQRIEES